MSLQAKDNKSFSPVSLINRSGKFSALIICEHASRMIPEEFGDLGLSEAARESHIAWDLGADNVASRLSKSLDAPYIKGEVSRLIYDCNRHPDANSAIPVKSETVEILGNQHLSALQRNARIQSVYQPFSDCIEDTLSRFTAPPAIITIHSFTPVFHGQERTVELGFLHGTDTRLADAILHAAPAHTPLNVQRNQPYGPQHGVTHTLRKHAENNGLLNLMIEIRNDLISNAEQCDKIAEMLHRLLQSTLKKIQATRHKQE